MKFCAAFARRADEYHREPLVKRHRHQRRFPITRHAFDADAPFGGYRQSGIGREMGIEGFEEYLQTKTVGLPA